MVLPPVDTALSGFQLSILSLYPTKVCIEWYLGCSLSVVSHTSNLDHPVKLLLGRIASETHRHQVLRILSRLFRSRSVSTIPAFSVSAVQGQFHPVPDSKSSRTKSPIPREPTWKRGLSRSLMFDLDVSPPNLPSPPSPSCVIPRRFEKVRCEYVSQVFYLIGNGHWVVQCIEQIISTFTKCLDKLVWSCSVFLIEILGRLPRNLSILYRWMIWCSVSFQSWQSASEDSNIDLKPCMSSDVPRNIRQVEYLCSLRGTATLDESLFSSLFEVVNTWGWHSRCVDVHVPMSLTSVLIQFRNSRNDFSISVMKSMSCWTTSINTPSVEDEFLKNPLNISQKPSIVAS